MKKVIILMVGLLLGLPGCWPENKQKDQVAKQLYIVDVNTKQVYDDCHIPGAIHVSFEQIDDFAKNLDKNTDMVIYCSNYRCSTSGMVVKKLKQMGFIHAKAFEAGIAKWHQEKRPIEGACSMSFLTMEMDPPAEHDGTIEIISSNDFAQLIEKYKKEGGIAKW